MEAIFRADISIYIYVFRVCIFGYGGHIPCMYIDIFRYGSHQKFPADIAIYLGMDVIINSVQIYRNIPKKNSALIISVEVEAAVSSKMSVLFYPTTFRYNS